MKKKLVEEILRNKKLMNINEDVKPSKITVSSDGIVNFWDLESKKVYRYRLVANTKVTGDMEIKIKSIDLENNTLEYIDPDTDEVKVDKISDESKNNILDNYQSEKDIDNLHTFKKKGFTVTIKLDFIEVQPLNIK